MTNKAAPLQRPAGIAPATTMEEIPVLSADERAALAASLVEAEQRIEAGEFIEYEQRAFKDRLQRLYRKAKQAKGA